MNRNGPIVVIEDDPEDQSLLEMIFSELGYQDKVVFFENGEEAIDYMKRPEVFPFIVISDINMPRISGFELRNRVVAEEGLAHKCIPYVFLSTAVNKQAVDHAFLVGAQGYFQKPETYGNLLSTVRNIIAYWRDCYSPSRFAA